MTERRKLKHTVRARMARTGESYTTAHRHVTRRAPTPVRHRESGLVRHLLAASGISLSEPMVCGLGGGVGFLYAVFEYAAVPHPLLTVVAQHHPQPWAPAVLSRLGVEYVELHSTSPASALAKLRAALADGPVLCTVNRAGLPGYADLSPFASADPYPVLVLGEAAGSLTVLDVTEKAVPVDVFAAAWAGHRKGRHHLLPYALGRLVDGVQREYTAADATRPLYADFLTEASPMLDNPSVAEAAAAFRASGRSWATVSRLASAPLDDPRQRLDELAGLVEDCLALERTAVQHLGR